MLSKKTLFTGAVILAISASLFVSCKKSSDEEETPVTPTPVTPAAASIKATINGTAWTASNQDAYLGSNAVIITGGSSSPKDSIYIAFAPGSFTYGVPHSAYGDLWIGTTKYAVGAGSNGYITITDTVGKKMTGTFNFNVGGQTVTSGTFTNLPF